MRGGGIHFRGKGGGGVRGGRGSKGSKFAAQGLKLATRYEVNSTSAGNGSGSISLAKMRGRGGLMGQKGGACQGL